MAKLCTKIINIGLDMLELFEHITVVWNFLRHSVDVCPLSGADMQSLDFCVN